MLIEHPVLVQLLGRRNVGVAEDELHVACLHTGGLQHRRRGVACLVNSDAAKPGTVCDLVECSHEVLRIDRRTYAAVQDETLTRSGRAGVETVSIGPCFKQRADLWKQGQGASASGGLHLTRDYLTCDALELLADMNGTGLEVDISPAQSDRFSAAHAVDEQQVESNLPRVVFGRGEEGTGIVDTPGMDLLRFVLREIDEASDVSVHQFFALGSAECG